MAVKIWIFFTVLVLLCRKELVSGSPWDGMSIYCNVEKYRFTAQRPGCHSEVFHTSACLGLCKSFVHLTGVYPGTTNMCMCCKAKTTIKRDFTFSRCDPGIDRRIQIESATECACQKINCS